MRVKGGKTGDHVMSWAAPDGIIENTGLAALYRCYWAERGQVYDHPSLHPETGLVDRLWHAAVDESDVFEIQKITAHHPLTATSHSDPTLEGYTVQWANFDRAVSRVSVADCIACDESVTNYWSSSLCCHHESYKNNNY